MQCCVSPVVNLLLAKAAFCGDRDSYLYAYWFHNAHGHCQVDTNKSSHLVEVVVDAISLLPLELIAVIWYEDSWAQTMYVQGFAMAC